MARKSLRSLAILAVLAALSAAQAFGFDPAGFESVCRIHSGSGVKRSAGSGIVFMLADGKYYVLTNKHVVDNNKTVQCEFWKKGYKSQEFPGDVVWSSFHSQYHRDVAIVTVNSTHFGGMLPKVIPFASPDTVLRDGQTVSSIGCAAAAWPTAWVGHITGVKEGSVTFVPPPAGGRSGSALLNADGTEIIGLVTWRAGDDTFGIAQNIQELYRAFEGSPPAPETYRETGSMNPLTEVAEEAQCPGGNCPIPPRGGGGGIFRTPQRPQGGNNGGGNEPFPGLGKLFPGLRGRQDENPPSDELPIPEQGNDEAPKAGGGPCQGGCPEIGALKAQLEDIAKTLSGKADRSEIEKLADKNSLRATDETLKGLKEDVFKLRADIAAAGGFGGNEDVTTNTAAIVQLKALVLENKQAIAANSSKLDALTTAVSELYDNDGKINDKVDDHGGHLVGIHSKLEGLTNAFNNLKGGVFFRIAGMLGLGAIPTVLLAIAMWFGYRRLRKRLDGVTGWILDSDDEDSDSTEEPGRAPRRPFPDSGDPDSDVELGSGLVIGLKPASNGGSPTNSGSSSDAVRDEGEGGSPEGESEAEAQPEVRPEAGQDSVAEKALTDVDKYRILLVQCRREGEMKQNEIDNLSRRINELKEQANDKNATEIALLQARLDECRKASQSKDALILELTKERDKKKQEPAPKPTPAPTPEPPPRSAPPIRSGDIDLPRLPMDYTKIWADHYEATGGSVNEERIRRGIYIEAVDRLRAGQFTRNAETGEALAAKIDTWVAQRFFEHKIPVPAVESNIYHQAYQGFCYQCAIEELKTGRILAQNHVEIAGRIENWVRLEYMRRLTQKEN